jgi:NADH:ubiquinone oxidoreductase subunit
MKGLWFLGSRRFACEDKFSWRGCIRHERIASDLRQSPCARRPHLQQGTAAPAELDISPSGWHQDPTKQGPCRMKQFFLKFFTWWNGQTFGTQLWTRRYGELVGQDEQGNLYYRTRGGAIDPALGFERRWVVYNGYAEASRIPPSWHGWMHHTVDVPPTQDNYQPREWEKPHQPNLTGTANAYRPSGSTLASGKRPKATGDYQPWTPS